MKKLFGEFEKALKEASFPRGCVVAAITRDDGSVVIPHGDDEFRKEDRMVLFVLHEVVEAVLQLVGVERE